MKKHLTWLAPLIAVAGITLIASIAARVEGAGLPPAAGETLRAYRAYVDNSAQTPSVALSRARQPERLRIGPGNTTFSLSGAFAVGVDLRARAASTPTPDISPGLLNPLAPNAVQGNVPARPLSAPVEAWCAGIDAQQRELVVALHEALHESAWVVHRGDGLHTALSCRSAT